MSPNLSGSETGILLAETDVINIPKQQQPHVEDSKKTQRPQYHWHIVWRNVVIFIYLHIGGIYGAYLLFTSAKILTLLWSILLGSWSALGITAGAHRLWAHKSYKATWQLKLILIFFQTLALQSYLYEWVRDHRVHHKFTDTDADPYNSRRGFFFSHIGWLMMKRHDDVKTKGKQIDMSDLENDPLVMFQKKYYVILMTLICLVIPTLVPVYFWNESFSNAWYVASILRIAFTLNATFCVNSVAHIWGTKPYDKNISPVQNLPTAIVTFGEGWHNYHHAFPWDYKAAELPAYKTNYATAFIDFFSRIGWAYDLKTVPIDMIEKRVKRTGDGSRISKDTDNEEYTHSHKGEVWGWDDKDMTEEDKEMVVIYNKKEI